MLEGEDLHIVLLVEQRIPEGSELLCSHLNSVGQFCVACVSSSADFS